MSNSFAKEDCLIRILDDDQELLEALEFALTNKGWACECYSDAETFFKELNPQQPGCLLLDIQMPQMDGLEVQRKLEKLGNGLTIIFMSNYGTLDTAVKAFRGGAFDFFKKPIVPDELFAAIERGVCKDRARLEAKFERSPAGKLEKLTDRERQVAGDLAQGLPSSLISEHLGISERTLERHR
ncbi:MAG: response regulator transcription factor [Burkholderiales bacterium]|nr:response regulator transcription factor [Burkholderiales bacterium]